MALYRVLRTIDKGSRRIDRGGIIHTGELPESHVEILVARGALSLLAAPPLAVLPGWKLRARKLEKAGIEDAGQLLEMDDPELEKVLKGKPGQAAKWKAEVAAWLTVPKPSG